jgi:hypothetical protein
MTAIVANHDCVVADARVSNGSTSFDSPKISTIKNRFIIGGAGHQKPFEVFCEWIKKFGIRPMPVLPTEMRDDSFEALVLDAKTGKLYLYDESFAQLEVTSSHYAIGCGSGPVMAVLAHIKRKGGEINEDALKDAVTATADVMEGVGLPLQVVKRTDIKTTRRKPK